LRSAMALRGSRQRRQARTQRHQSAREGRNPRNDRGLRPHRELRQLSSRVPHGARERDRRSRRFRRSWPSVALTCRRASGSLRSARGLPRRCLPSDGYRREPSSTTPFRIAPVLLYQTTVGPAATNSLGKAYFENASIPVVVGADGSIASGIQSTTALYLLRLTQTREQRRRTTLEAFDYCASVGLTTHVDQEGIPGAAEPAVRPRKRGPHRAFAEPESDALQLRPPPALGYVVGLAPRRQDDRSPAIGPGDGRFRRDQ
jgi:hypothetical protein